MNASGVTVGDVNSFNNAQNSPSANSTLMKIMTNTTGYHAVTVVNATAVEFHLTNAFVAFLQSIDTAPWVFVDPYVVQQHGGVAPNTPNPYMSVNGTLVGDAPYVMQNYVPNQFSLLVANPHYWAQNMTNNLILEPAKIHSVLINYKTDELTRTEDLEAAKATAAIVSFNDINATLSACKACYIPNTGTSGSIEWINIDSLKGPDKQHACKTGNDRSDQRLPDTIGGIRRIRAARCRPDAEHLQLLQQFHSQLALQRD